MDERVAVGVDVSRGKTPGSPGEGLGFLVQSRLQMSTPPTRIIPGGGGGATEPDALRLPPSAAVVVPSMPDVEGQDVNELLMASPPTMSRRGRQGTGCEEPNSKKKKVAKQGTKVKAYIVKVEIPPSPSYDFFPPPTTSSPSLSPLPLRPLPCGAVLNHCEIPSGSAPLVTCCKTGPGNTVSLGYGVRPTHGVPHSDGHTVFEVYKCGGGRMERVGVVRDKEDDVNIGMGVGGGKWAAWAYGTKQGKVRVWTAGDR